MLAEIDNIWWGKRRGHRCESQNFIPRSFKYMKVSIRFSAFFVGYILHFALLGQCRGFSIRDRRRAPGTCNGCIGYWMTRQVAKRNYVVRASSQFHLRFHTAHLVCNSLYSLMLLKTTFFSLAAGAQLVSILINALKYTYSENQRFFAAIPFLARKIVFQLWNNI